jgi:antitoxin component YwqK of YwqJK toxin-antitoxin module
VKTKAFYLSAVFILCSFMAAASWPPWFAINQYNKKGERHGRWVYYWDSTNKIPMNKLRFKNGHEFGLNRYYSEKGKVWLKFKARKDGRMKVTYYDENGRKERKGKALMIIDPLEVRYSWNGKWRFYKNGKLVKTVVYEMGLPLEEEMGNSGQ